MKVDVGWLFTAVAFGLFLGALLKDFIPIMSLMVVIAHLVYVIYIISTEVF